MMPRYMLDTDTCSYIMKRSNDRLLLRLQGISVSDVCISVITKAELIYGVEMSTQRQRDESSLRAFLEYVQALDFPDRASPEYARIRAELKKRGAMIGANDLFIAAQACSLGLTLITNNTREFKRVRNLAVENWAG